MCAASELMGNGVTFINIPDIVKFLRLFDFGERASTYPGITPNVLCDFVFYWKDKRWFPDKEKAQQKKQRQSVMVRKKKMKKKVKPLLLTPQVLLVN